MVSDSSGETPPGIDITLQKLVLDSTGFGDFLGGLAGLAATVLSRPGAGVTCGITVTHPKKAATVGGSDAGARALDELQAETRQGPGLTAIGSQTAVLVPDLDREQRWPRFLRAASERGVGSVLSVPLPAEGQSRGVLTLYAKRADAFPPEDVTTARAFTRQASPALRLALRIAQLTDTRDHLTAAMHSRSIIDTALGVVMAQNRCGRDQAFGILVDAANTRETKLRRVAASIIASVSGEKDITTHFKE
ncbi:ANTAR domain-containing protein [Arthrobacter sp. 92]|uniref:ANTAR domain-containing protein n=1 Tax=Arthrobacter sp. 92 TaxID=3418175 RepID=UPI003D0548C3